MKNTRVGLGALSLRIDSPTLLPHWRNPNDITLQIMIHIHDLDVRNPGTW